jgi:hypothetical protein
MEALWIGVIIIVVILGFSFSITLTTRTGKPINWPLISFYVLSTLLLVNICGWLWNTDRQIAAGLTLVLLLLVFTFYWFRWFSPATQAPIPADLQTSCGTDPTIPPSCNWPPIVNMCPDFMVAWQNEASGDVYCYDVHDVYGLRVYNGAGIQSGLKINNSSNQSAILIISASKNKTAVQIKDDKNGQRWPFAHQILNNLANLCQGNMGSLRWEGVIEAKGELYYNAERNINRAYGLPVLPPVAA